MATSQGKRPNGKAARSGTNAAQRAAKKPDKGAGMAADFASRYPPRPPAGPPETVDPGWLLRALGLTLVAGLVLSYAAVCLLLYQGAWQFILHPSAKVAQTPAAAGLAFEAVQFDAAATGRPRLTGWLVPAEQAAGAQAPRTLLLLHDGQGSLADTVPLLESLHRTGADVFAFDYRGFGTSAGPHPSEARMHEDAEAAFEYLRDSRHVDPSHLVPFGEGLGGALALGLAAAHPEIRAVAVDNPPLHVAERVVDGQRSRLIPVRLLVRDRFEFEPALGALATPKLLIAGGPRHQAVDAEVRQRFHAARDPKFLLDLPAAAPGADNTDAYVEGLRRFLDLYP